MTASQFTILTALALGSTLGQPALAEPIVMPLASVVALAESAHLDRDGFERQLEIAVPGLWLGPDDAREADREDPFFWTMVGTFGGTGGTSQPGTIFACARYGFATRDALSEHGLVTPETFGLMQRAMVQFDDAERWPETAIARLYCSFVWDDARVVEILPEAEARQGLALQFDEITRVAGGGVDQLAFYGAEGFRLETGPGVESATVVVEGAVVVLTLGHQQVTFRSYLLNGGM